MTPTPTGPEPAGSGGPVDGAAEDRDAAVHVFIGKGGVGKTTCAAATALHFAGRGQRTLAISTDPTPSLSHIFGLRREEPPIEPVETASEGSTGRADDAGGPPPATATTALPVQTRAREIRPGLDMLELGLEEVRRMWDERFGRDVYAVFSAFVDVDYPAFVAFMTAVLPGLNEEFMVDHIRRLAEEGSYRRIVWDTAPLGQTLALLETPALLGEHLRMAPRIYSRMRTSGQGRESILEVLRRWQALAEACMTFLRQRASFTMVTIAEALAVDQLEGVFAEMRAHGLGAERLIVNNVVSTTDSEFLRRKAQGQAVQLRRLRETYAGLRIQEIPLFPYEIRGVDRLDEVSEVLYG